MSTSINPIVIPEQLISANKLFLKQGGKILLQDINLSIKAGEIVTIIGPNGAGKTTLLNILLGLRPPSSGHVERKKGLRIGYMPQRLQLNPQLPLSVERFLLLTNTSLISIDDALEKTGITHLKKTDISQLSGGELQRMLLSRALLRQPQLLVLDEPVQGVDIRGQDKLYKLIRELRDELNCGILMVSHDLHLVMAATDHVICLNQHVCCHGHPESVSNHPAYLELFGSDANQLATYSHHHDHKHNLHGEIIAESKNESDKEKGKEPHSQICQHGDH